MAAAALRGDLSYAFSIPGAVSTALFGGSQTRPIDPRHLQHRQAPRELAKQQQHPSRHAGARYTTGHASFYGNHAVITVDGADRQTDPLCKYARRAGEGSRRARRRWEHDGLLHTRYGYLHPWRPLQMERVVVRANEAAAAAIAACPFIIATTHSVLWRGDKTASSQGHAT